ncbi:MAG: hypothetical protein VCD00_16695, partial [Candidatus Hydrogenedentota bacterium]
MKATFVLLLTLTLSPMLFATPLEAGTAVLNITPDVKNHPTPLGGYGERENAPAVGVHDNTMAKALILKQGDKKFALVTLDLLGVPRS